MGAIGYFYADLVKDLGAGDLTLTNEDSNYPTENSQNEQIALTTRTTDKVNILYQFDLGSAKQPRFFFLGNHNLSGGTVKVYSYSDAGFSVNQTNVGNFTYRAMDMYLRLGSAPTARQYWEFDFSKNGSATSGDSYFEIGRPMIGLDYVTLTDIEHYVRPRGYGFRNIINETTYGVRWAHKLAEKRERFELYFNERVNVTLASEMRTLYETIYGDAHPFVLIPDVTKAHVYYGYLEDPELMWQEIFGIETTSHTGEVRIRFIEAVRGKV